MAVPGSSSAEWQYPLQNKIKSMRAHPWVSVRAPRIYEDMFPHMVCTLALTALWQCLCQRHQLPAGKSEIRLQTPPSSSTIEYTSYKILTAADANLYILEFKPYCDPPSLQEVLRLDGAIVNGSLPWVTRHPYDQNLFIIANDNHDYGNLTSWRYDPSAVDFTLLDSVVSKGSCAHIAVSPDGTHVHVANLYGNGAQGPSGALVPLNVATGKFGELVIPPFLDFSNYTLKEGQDNSSQLLRHPHHWAFHPYLPVAYLSDLGGDVVHRYSIDGPGQLTELEPIVNRLASGPRRTVVHPSGAALYIMHEIDSTITVVSVDTNTTYGDTKIVQDNVTTIRSYADHSPNAFMGSELQLSTDGRFLYAGSRNNTAPAKGQENIDEIALFSVSPNGTHIEFVEFIAANTWYLRYFGLSSPYIDQTVRAQKYLIAGGQNSNNTVIFERDVFSGGLTEVVSINGTDRPVSYTWL